VASVLGVAALCALCAALALGERHQQGQLIVALDGRISPPALPRHRLAPVTVSLSSRLSTVGGSPLPRVRRIDLAFGGRSMNFDRRGLPVCPRARLRNATSEQALARCRSALVGHGRLEAELLLPHQTPLRVHARLLDFNGRAPGGGLAVLVQAFSTRPPASFVLSFVAHRGRGSFPTALTAAMPQSIGAWPHLTAFQTTLGRRFRHGGAVHSYLNASCPAPPHFTAGFISFARIGYAFPGDRSISDTIVRGCRVRR
jgi:hypothetical protein